jgi:glycolate oxidase FAD binding subunit
MALNAASWRGELTVISGGGTKIGWGRTPARVDLVINTSKLDVVTHRYGISRQRSGAGATLAAVNGELARHNQWLLSTAPSTTRRLAGSWRRTIRGRCGIASARHDRLLGVTLAMTDGRLVKAGGTVVKNVAGYDLGRLISGSRNARRHRDRDLKLAPLPAASGSLRARYADGVAFVAQRRHCQRAVSI